jgi:cell division septation protein DedD
MGFVCSGSTRRRGCEFGMSKKSHPSKKVKYQIELSSTSLVFWVVCIVFFMGWIFVLGVLVGRGFLPGANTAIADLKTQVTKLQEMVARTKRADRKSQTAEDIDSKLGFYDKLESRKEDTKRPFPELPPERPKSEKAGKPSDLTLADVRAGIAKKESAAKKQDMAKNAGAEKNVKEVAPDPTKQAEKVSGPFRYVIQIAALDEKSKAEDMVRKLSEGGVEAYLQETVVKGKTFYRVRCGKFLTKEEANAYGQKLPKEAGTRWRVVNVE